METAILETLQIGYLYAMISSKVHVQVRFKHQFHYEETSPIVFRGSGRPPTNMTAVQRLPLVTAKAAQAKVENCA